MVREALAAHIQIRNLSSGPKSLLSRELLSEVDYTYVHIYVYMLIYIYTCLHVCVYIYMCPIPLGTIHLEFLICVAKIKVQRDIWI